MKVNLPHVHCVLRDFSPVLNQRTIIFMELLSSADDDLWGTFSYSQRAELLCLITALCLKYSLELHHWWWWPGDWTRVILFWTLGWGFCLFSQFRCSYFSEIILYTITFLSRAVRSTWQHSVGSEWGNAQLCLWRQEAKWKQIKVRLQQGTVMKRSGVGALWRVAQADL